MTSSSTSTTPADTTAILVSVVDDCIPADPVDGGRREVVLRLTVCNEQL